VRGDDWRRVVIDRTDIRQADLSSGNRSSTRVRIKDAEIATLTVRSKRAELQGIEVEYSVSAADAE
jgi:CYTH domain-containing protein